MNIDSNGITFKTCENGYIERYDIGNSYVAKEYHSGDIRYGKLYMIDENGNKTRFSEIHDLERYYLIQLADGRIVIYNCGTIGRQSDVLVWIINTDGTVEELFGNVTGEFVYSTINISGDSLIVSLLRYEKWEKMQHVLFKEDELSGTWSINLNTSEAKLITKTFYKGLYVFGNQIYCVDQNDRFSVLQP
ncbi:MAG: hypothetical protein K6G89_06000 [Clostridia bacterium]|nr:hypothetical protein [Clostridia bacterium]